MAAPAGLIAKNPVLPVTVVQGPARPSSFSRLIARIQQIALDQVFYVKGDRVITSKTHRFLHFVRNWQTYNAVKEMGLLGNDYLSTTAVNVNALISEIELRTRGGSIPTEVSEYFSNLREETDLKDVLSTANGFKEIETKLTQFVTLIKDQAQRVIDHLQEFEHKLDEIHRLNQNIAKEKAQAKSLGERCDNLESQIKAITSQINGLTQQLEKGGDAQNAQIKNSIEDLKAEVNPLIVEQKVAALALESAVQGVQAQLKSAESNYAKLKAYSQASHEFQSFNLDTLETLTKLHDQEITENNDKENQLQREIQKLRDQINDLQAREKQRTASDKSTQDNYARELDKAKADLGKKIDETIQLRAENTTLRNEKAELGQLLEVERKEKAQLVETIKLKDKEIEELKTANAKLQQDCQELRERMEKQHKEHAEVLGGLNSQLDSLIKQDKAQTAQVESLLIEMRERDQQVFSQAIQTTALADQLRQTQEEQRQRAADAARLQEIQRDIRADQARLTAQLAHSVNLNP